MCVSHTLNQSIPGLKHEGCVLQRVSFGTLSDVTVVLGMRHSIDIDELANIIAYYTADCNVLSFYNTCTRTFAHVQIINCLVAILSYQVNSVQFSLNRENLFLRNIHNAFLVTKSCQEAGCVQTINCLVAILSYPCMLLNDLFTFCQYNSVTKHRS